MCRIPDSADALVLDIGAWLQDGFRKRSERIDESCRSGSGRQTRHV